MKKVLVAIAIVAMAVTSAHALSLQPGVTIGQYWNFENLYTGQDLASANSGWYLDQSNGWSLARTDVNGAYAAGDIYLGDNWGVIRLNSLTPVAGSAYYSDLNQPFPRQEVTGIFYGIDVISFTQVGSNFLLIGSGGQLDLYNELNTTAATRFRTGPGVTNFEYNPASIGVSGGLPTYVSATEGTRVASLLLDDGITGTAGETVQATFLGGFPSNGSASGYLSVIPDAAPWAGMLNTDYFVTAFGGRDALNQNSFFNTNNGAIGVGGLHGWTLFSSDPIQIAPTPEPGTFALLGLGVLGLGICVRRRRRS
jgi:hypothetical protein